MNKKRILVVDDEPHIVNLIKLSIAPQEYDVITAYSAREAMDIMENKQPDIVVLDLMMPGFNGYQLCEKLRSDKKTAKTPILILSAKSQVDDKLHALDVGASDYMTKPFDPMELVRRIELNLQTTI